MLSTMSTELWCNPAECSFQSRKFDERGGNTSHTRSRKKESLPTLWEDAVLLTDSEILWLQSGVVDPRRRFTKKQHKCTVAPWQARRRELRLARRFAKTFVPEANKIPSRQCHVSGVSGVLRGTLRSSPPLRQVSTHCVPTPVLTKRDTVILRLLTDPNANVFVDEAVQRRFPQRMAHRMVCRPSGCPIRHKNDLPTLVWPPRRRFDTTSYVWSQSRLDRTDERQPCVLR